MAVHKYRPGAPRRPLADPLSQRIAADFGRCILALRLECKLPRSIVVAQTGINWKRLRALEEGWQVAALDEVAKLVAVYGVNQEQERFIIASMISSRRTSL
jgi:hypothetical protein